MNTSENKVSKGFHELKTHPEYFESIWNREKLFEVRKDDRNYQVGDNLKLREYDPFSSNFSTREIYANIAYKLEGGQFGIEEGFCVLSLQYLNNYLLQVSNLKESDEIFCNSCHQTVKKGFCSKQNCG